MTQSQSKILLDKLSEMSGSIKVLGIDASLRGTGWAMLKDKRIIDYGVIKTNNFGMKGFSSLEADSIQMHQTSNNIDLLVKGLNPDLIVIEIPHITQRASVAIQIGIVWGCLSSLLSKTNCLAIDQSYLKNWSLSRKGDKKNKVEEKVRRRVMVDSNDDNIIDAIGICLMIQDHYDYIDYKRQGSSQAR